MNVGRSSFRMIPLASGNILAVGGLVGTTATGAAEIYNVATSSWTSVAPLNLARYGQELSLLPSGTVLAAGGTSVGGNTNTAEVYDPVADTWTFTGSMSTVRINFQMVAY